MVSVSGLSLNVNKLAVSVGYDLVETNPPHVSLFPVLVAFILPVLLELPARHLFLAPPVRVTL